MELIKTAAIIVLFVLMTVLASAEIVQTQLFSISPAEDIDIKSLLVLYDDRPQSSIAPYIMPEFLGYSIGGVTRGLFGGETTMRGIYGVLHDFLAELLTAGVCKTLPDAEGDRIWDKAREGDFVYICYFHELPASAIAYSVSEGETELAEGDVPYIRELFITPLQQGGRSWGLVTRSESGKVSIYSPKPDSDGLSFDESSVTAYNNSRQLVEFDFIGDISPDAVSDGEKIDESGETEKSTAGEMDGDAHAAQESSQGDAQNEPDAPEVDPVSPIEALAHKYGLRDTTVLAFGDFSQKYITVETGPQLTERILDGIASTELLGLFDINTERVAPYRSQGYTIYLGESGRVRFSDAGGIDYMAVSPGGTGKGGVPVSSFLGYENYGGRYTFYELLGAAASLLDKIESITPELLGGDAYPGLVSVSAGDEGLELAFGYFCDGYRIIGLGPAITMTFADGALTNLAMTPARITKGGACVSLPQSWAIIHLYRDIAAAEGSNDQFGSPGAVDAGRRPSALTIAYNVEDAARRPAETEPGSEGGEGDDTADVDTQPVTGDETEAGDTNAASAAETERREPTELQFSPDWVILTSSGAAAVEARYGNIG